MCLGAVLYVYKGEWGLPSIDLECLRCLCLVKFTRCPVEIETNGNPVRSGTGKLPYLQIGNKKFCGYQSIKQFLDKEGYPIDRHLRGKPQALSHTYSNFVFTDLHVYYYYVMYGDPNNYEMIRNLYAQRTPFPFNFFYPSGYHKEANEIMTAMAGFSVYDKLEKHESSSLVVNAKQCINKLSRKLGKKVWFFGDVFSEFDATVYAYLSLLIKSTLPNNPLQIHIKACQNLLNFISRISKDIFKDEAFNSMKTTKGCPPNDPLLTATERSFLESEKKTKILAGIGAVVAMGVFAAWRGIFSKIGNPRRFFDALEYEEDEDDELQ